MSFGSWRIPRKNHKEITMATTGESEDESNYDYEFVEPPPERLLCRICHLPCRNAQSNEADHIYCKRCITKVKPSASVSDPCAHCTDMLNTFYQQCRWTVM